MHSTGLARIVNLLESVDRFMNSSVVHYQVISVSQYFILQAEQNKSPPLLLFVGIAHQLGSNQWLNLVSCKFIA
jgi:hypothetical protein